MTALVASDVNADHSTAHNIEPTPSANHKSSDLASTAGERRVNEVSPEANGSSDDGIAHELASACKLLSDETRLRILRFLTETKELNVRTLCELLGQSQPAVSHHLALMREFGMIASRRQGKNNFYRIIPDRIQKVQTIIDELFIGRLEIDEVSPVRLPR